MKHKINILILALNITLISLFITDLTILIIALTAALLFFVIIMSFGVINMRFNYFLKSYTRLNNNECLLTFDDGPDPELTPVVLQILKEKGVKAIFFIIGEKAEQQKEILQQIQDEGHVIGNHTYSHHPFLSMQSTSKVKTDLTKGQSVLERLTGKRIQLFRPPIGYTNPNIARALQQLRLKNVGWTVRSFDSVYKDDQTFVSRMVSKIKNGTIVLFHDNLEVTARNLGEIIDQCRQNGIKFVSESDIENKLNA